MSNTPVAWTTVVEKGRTAKFVVPVQNKSAGYGNKDMITSVELYGDEDLQGMMLAQKAKSIVQQALTPGSVIFSLPADSFGHQSEAYKLIEEQISNTVQGFRTISNYTARSSKDLMIEVKFKSIADR